MAKALLDFQNYVDYLVSDKKPQLDTTKRDEFIQQAVSQYSNRRPQVITETITGDGNAYLSLPSGFDENFSTILGIEYPLDQQPPQFLKMTDYMLQAVPISVEVKGVRIAWPSSNYPPVDVEAYFSYTLKHALKEEITGTATAATSTTLTDLGSGWTADAYINMIIRITDGTGEGQVRKITMNTTEILTVSVAWTTNPSTDSTFTIIDNSIPDGNFEAVCVLAASIYEEALAAYYAQTASMTINVDAMNFRTRSAECASRAEDFREEYDRLVPVLAAGAVGDWNVGMQKRSTDRLIHKGVLRS